MSSAFRTVLPALAVTLLLAGCAGVGGSSHRAGHFRHVEARPSETIFSPLDLPAPTAIRTGAGAPGPAYWQQQVDYVIEASLDPRTDTVRGVATVTYINNSPDALNYLWLHLEQNIFRADSIGAAVSSRSNIGMDEASGDGYDIEYIRSGGRDLDLHVYDTLGLVPLDQPIAPVGGAFTFEIAWSFVVPENAFRRFGQEQVEQGTIYEIAQWFPAVVVYDDTYGWNTLPYLGTGEFYTNFGNYDVKLTVPRSHICVATGALQNSSEVLTPTQVDRLNEARASEDQTVFIVAPEEVGTPESRPQGTGPLTWHFTAENVRTFAWATSEAFIYDAASLGDTLIQSAYPKEATPNWHDSTQMLRTAIKGYNEQWYEYPYPVATNVNGPEGGMEYPMIIFCGSRTSERGLYGVTTHEIGHNWFPMIVNTDERRHAWMDEGFNSFINYYSTELWFGEGERGRRGDAARFAQGMLSRETVPAETIPDHIPPGQLGTLNYAKPAVGLVLLREQILGPDRFDFAFRRYIHTWAFRSPRPADFFRIMEDAAGADLAWFWRGWFLETGWLDQAIARVEQDVNEISGDRAARLTIDNRGELVMPVVLELTYDNGDTERITLPVEIWFSSNRFTKSMRTEREITKVVIDPDEKFPDVNRTNNQWGG